MITKRVSSDVMFANIYSGILRVTCTGRIYGPYIWVTFLTPVHPGRTYGPYVRVVRIGLKGLFTMLARIRACRQHSSMSRFARSFSRNTSQLSRNTPPQHARLPQTYQPRNSGHVPSARACRRGLMRKPDARAPLRTAAQRSARSVNSP